MLYGPASNRNSFRVERFRQFRRIVERVIAEQDRCRIVDVGGTGSYWELFAADLDWTRVELTIVNLKHERDGPPGTRTMIGDARDLAQFSDGAFDVVHSNSVLEHVGRWGDMQRMAQEVRRLAPRYFVQTPYFWFPLDPHTRVPFFHWFAEPVRYRIAMAMECGFWKRCESVAEAMKVAESSSLLDGHQLRTLFPDADIVRERVFGVTKSLLAVRH